jgi:UPF0271 protein
MKKILVLDAPAFIRGCQPYQGEECYTVEEVLREIRRGDTGLKVELSVREGRLRVESPRQRSLDNVEETATESGDIALLSEADLKLLALALDLKEDGKKVAIVTDDYDIQNVASLLGIEYLPLAERGIRKVLRWKNICKGCGKRFPIKYKGRCDVCGSKLRILRR